MNGRRERTLQAYRDGSLSDRQRARVERWLQADAESRSFVARTDALGRVVREAWNEGPPAPSPERIMAAIRPAMRRIDAERREQSLWTRLSRALAPSLSPPGSVFEWATATALSAAAVVAAIVAVPSSGDVRREAQHLVALPAAPVFAQEVAQEVSWPSSVYDLAQGDTPLRVYEKENATVIYLGEEPDPDDISFGLVLADWA